jgi:hypothetical protein
VFILDENECSRSMRIRRQDIPDEELLKRLRFIYTPPAVALIREQLHAYRREGNESAAATLRNRYTYRMYDISEYFKAIKQRFSHYYNAREDRTGPLWDQRFKSVLVEKSEDALLTMAAYIDLNPVRAGLVRDPKEYRFCGYGAALGGNQPARQGLRRLMQAVTGGDQFSWTEAQTVYRQRLYIQGRQKGVDPEGRPIRQGFSPEAVAAVVESGGTLPLHEVLRCRVRYFSDGLVLGSRAFVDGVFARYRCHFGAKRQSGARAMRFGEWQKLCTLRDLRLSPIVRYNNT